MPEPTPKLSVDELVTQNERLAHWMAHRFSARHPYLEADDIDQEAMLALFKAASTYDSAKGQFAGYASRCISNQLGKMSWKKRVQGPALSRVDLDATAGDDEGEEEAHTMVADPNAKTPAELLVKRGLNQQVKSEVANLDPREREIVTRYIAGEGYREIAADMGISFVYVGKIYKAALEKLRQKLQQESLKELVTALLSEDVDFNRAGANQSGFGGFANRGGQEVDHTGVLSKVVNELFTLGVKASVEYTGVLCINLGGTSELFVCSIAICAGCFTRCCRRNDARRLIGRKTKDRG